MLQLGGEGVLGLADQEEQEVWESFYIGLLELFDVPVQEWPLATRKLRPRDLRQDLISKAEELVS